MLIILPVFPFSAPVKTVFRKQVVAQVSLLDFVIEGSFTVQIRLSRNRFYDAFSIDNLRIRIIKRIDIYSQTQAVF